MESGTSKGSELQVEVVNGVTVVRFPDGVVLDDDHVHGTAEQLYQLAAGISGGIMVLNFSKVDHISSVGLGAMVSLYKKLMNNESKLAVCELIPRLKDLFDIVHLEHLFAFYDTEGDAVKAGSQAS